MAVCVLFFSNVSSFVDMQAYLVKKNTRPGKDGAKVTWSVVKKLEARYVALNIHGNCLHLFGQTGKDKQILQSKDARLLQIRVVRTPYL